MADSRGISDAAGGKLKIQRATTVTLPTCVVPAPALRDVDALREREWLVTNGVGGFASGTVAGTITRRYHGLLVAALENPLGRMVLLNALSESIDPTCLTEFRLEGGLPVWRFEYDGRQVEKQIVMPHRQNTVVVVYRSIGGDVTLHLTPAVHFRTYDALVSDELHEHYSFTSVEDHYELTTGDLPTLRIAIEGTHSFVVGERRRDRIPYSLEEARGYAAQGALWSPGSFTIDIPAGGTAAFIASAEDVNVMRAMSGVEAIEFELERKRRLIAASPPSTQHGAGAQLVVSADQFIIKPVGRIRDTMRAEGVGDELRTVIAGYHWFTDWGRDTMISLEGLTLATGRYREAGFVLRTFAQYVRDGLIPNLFPDGSDQGLYHTADATLWFFHALDRYAEATGSWLLIEQVLPTLRTIVDLHLRGTRFGIGVDAADGLLRQGAPGYQLTWMDAKVDDWVVTPRRGKAVEINALWYNALCLMSSWEEALGHPERATRYRDETARVREAFNARFWFADGRYLYDVVDGENGDDPACRPNQILAISLTNPVLDSDRWAAVVDVVNERLVTPVGLRSLAPDHPDYKARYFGDLRTRDAAYHQGTVWAWLIGPWIDAWLRVHPGDQHGARRFLDGLIAHLPDFGIGSIAEIFDAESPYRPRGCIAQAWSVAEVLRCWVKTADG